MKILEQLWYDGLHPSEVKSPADSRYLKQLAAVLLGLCPKPRLGNFFEKKFPKNLQKTFVYF